MTNAAGPVLVVGSSHLAIAVADTLAQRGVDVVTSLEGCVVDELRAAMFCDDDDVGNIAEAIDLHELAPDLRLVIRSFNSRIRERLPELLGDCRVLSASRLAAPHLVDLAVGTGGPDRAPRRGSLIACAAATSSPCCASCGDGRSFAGCCWRCCCS